MFCRGCSGELMVVVAAMMNDKVQQEHQDQHAAEGDDDGCSRRRIDYHAEITAERGHERAHCPADSEAWADAVREKHCADAGNNQVAKDEKNTSYGYG